jgi:phage gpG-like protein
MGVEITGIPALKARLKSLSSAKKQALKAAGVAVLTVSQQTIINQGNGDWPAWSPNYHPKRAHQMLWETGTLLRSLSLGGAGNEFDQEADSVTVGTNVVYAAAQNFGYPAGHLPARPFLDINDRMKQMAQAAFTAAFRRSIKP